MFNVKILRDSVCIGCPRITTFEVTYPRMVHAERLRHRSWSCNVASSRAIPINKYISNVVDDPVIPIHWGQNQQGMQAYEEIDDEGKRRAEAIWDEYRLSALKYAKQMQEVGVHKQIVNRMLELWSWTTEIITLTNFENFRQLRCHGAAEHHIRKIAEMMRDERAANEPWEIEEGDWHIPMLSVDDFKEHSLMDCVKIATGKCARVSYMTHDGIRDAAKDIELHNDLLGNKHLSPFEHCAKALPYDGTRRTRRDTGNFTGWLQYRKMLPELYGVTECPPEPIYIGNGKYEVQA